MVNLEGYVWEREGLLELKNGLLEGMSSNGVSIEGLL